MPLNPILCVYKVCVLRKDQKQNKCDLSWSLGGWIADWMADVRDWTDSWCRWMDDWVKEWMVVKRMSKRRKAGATEACGICASRASSVAQLYAQGGYSPCFDMSEAVINDPEALLFPPLTSPKTPTYMHPPQQSHCATPHQPNAHRQIDMTWKPLVLLAKHIHTQSKYLWPHSLLSSSTK